MKKDTISKIYFMNESTSFLSLFTPRNKTFMKACQRTRKSCTNTARCIIKHPLVFNLYNLQ